MTSRAMTTSNDTRPTKRVKTNNNPYLPNVVFRNIMSYIVDPYHADRQAHKQRMAMIMFQISVLQLYHPVHENWHQDERQEDVPTMVLQYAVSDDLEHEGYDFRSCDIRTQSTLETRETLVWIREYIEEVGYLYNDPKDIKLKQY
jgi:hypothetical protein